MEAEIGMKQSYQSPRLETRLGHQQGPDSDSLKQQGFIFKEERATEGKQMGL